jgi:hypothetical protein
LRSFEDSLRNSENSLRSFKEFQEVKFECITSQMNVRSLQGVLEEFSTFEEF